MVPARVKRIALEVTVTFVKPVRSMKKVQIVALVLTLGLAAACSSGRGTATDPEKLAQHAAWLEASRSGGPGSVFFLQMADTQFGMFSTPLFMELMGLHWRDGSFGRETQLFGDAIVRANVLRPDFVVICGDLINRPGHPKQRDEFQRIAATLDDSIPLYLVAGNHDVGNEPTEASLALYREHFGRDWYSFRSGANSELYGIVLNSVLIDAPDQVPSEAEAQLSWLEQELVAARDSGATSILVFQHHPFFLELADEEKQYFNIEPSVRSEYLRLFEEAGVDAVLAGHYHRNSFGRSGKLQMITTGPVGKPLGDGRSGFRAVHVTSAGLEHIYVPLN
jgi:3',5'-cyclic AMP phosphodiesterase CpdA